MARYDYKCSSCGNVFEVEHPMSETPEVVCPNCGAPAAKTFSPSVIKFEGSGFYNPDQGIHSVPTRRSSDRKCVV